MAPNLHGAFGAKAGAANAPRNSAALKASKLTWNAANLDAYLAAPAKLVPGTNMPVAGANPKDRQNLIAYLAKLKQRPEVRRAGIECYCTCRSRWALSHYKKTKKIKKNQ